MDPTVNWRIQTLVYKLTHKKLSDLTGVERAAFMLCKQLDLLTIDYNTDKIVQTKQENGK